MSNLSQLIADLPTSPPPPQSSPPPLVPHPEPRLAPNGPTPKPPALSWEEHPAFREVFLVHFPPLAAEALREAGRYLYDAVLEHELREPEEPWIRARVRALAADLRFTAQVLATLADARIEAGLTADEFTLAMKAEPWAEEVERFAGVLEAAVGAKP